MKHLTWIELNSGNLFQNIQKINSITGKKRIILPVKSNAYGHGLLEISKKVAPIIDMFFVADIEEAFKLKNARIERNIFIDLPIIDEKDIEEAALNGFRINISNFEQMELLKNVSRKHSSLTIYTHIEFDTGMNRTGFKENELLKLYEKFNDMPGNIHTEGIFTHFATAGENMEEFEAQLRLFKHIVSNFPYKVDYIHAENSAAVFTDGINITNAVRPGIATYGLSPSSKLNISVKPVLTWKTRIVEIKHLAKGDGVSYGLDYRATKPLRIATLPVGYGYGYMRILGKAPAYVLVNGQKCKIIGRICMNHMMIDITNVPARLGDVVTLIGQDGKSSITADELATMAGTINYEILTSIKSSIKRIFIQS